MKKAVKLKEANYLRAHKYLDAYKSCGIFLLLTHSLFAYSNDCNLSTSSTKEPNADKLQHCWYGIAELGYSRLDPDAKSAGWRVSDDNDTGWSLAAGWRFWPKWFTEFKYANHGEARVSNGSANASIDYVTSSLMVGYDLYPVNDSLQLYVKAGIANIDESIRNSSSISVSGDNLNFASGAGLEYRWDNPWFARMNLDIYSQDLQMLGFSIGRYFGQPSSGQATTKNKTNNQSRLEKQSIEIRESEAEVIIHAPLPKNEPKTEPVKTSPAKPTQIRKAQKRIQSTAKQDTRTQTSEDCASLAGIMENIQFDSNSSYMRPAGKAQLKEYAELIKRYPKTSILISAHTDSMGDDNYNQHMSKKRAKRVADYLITLGVDADQLASEGVGEQKPIATNDTEEGRAANRRVEFTIISSDVCVE